MAAEAEGAMNEIERESRLADLPLTTSVRSIVDRMSVFHLLPLAYGVHGTATRKIEG